jgi:hypothetical protein
MPSRVLRLVNIENLSKPLMPVLGRNAARFSTEIAATMGHLWMDLGDEHTELMRVERNIRHT